MALSKSYIDTQGVTKRGVWEGVMSVILLSWNIRPNRSLETSTVVCQEMYELCYLAISVSQNYVDFRQWGKLYLMISWFNFILGLNFVSLCLKFIIVNDHTPKTKGNKIGIKDKIELQHS